MNLYKSIIIVLLIFSIVQKTNAQNENSIKAKLELQSIITTNNVVPFWMRSNRNGSIPLEGLSGSLLGRMSKEYLPNINRNQKIDWGFGIETRLNSSLTKSNLIFTELYLKGKVGIFQMKIGRDKDVMGLTGDTSLSSGNFTVSGNALGVPRFELSIPEYYRINMLDGIFSFKGNITHGWIGKTRILDSLRALGNNNQIYYINDNRPVTYIHQKSLYVRLGKEDWRLALYGGFNHQVFWGNEQNAYGNSFKLTPIQTFFYVATGKSYGAPGVPTSKIGNQIGSIDLAMAYKFESLEIKLYRQNFYDVGALSKLANISDGLNGIVFKNLKPKQKQHFYWDKLLVEYFSSKNQAGYPWSTPTKSGDEDYYNNFYYLDGWSYKGLGLGNPFITTVNDARPGQISKGTYYFINNRINALHLGIEGSLNSYNFKSKLSYSWNYGTFGTSIYGSSTGIIRNPGANPSFVPVQQFSFYFDCNRAIKNGFEIGLSAAVDNGKLLNNSQGIILKVSKEFGL